MQILAFFKEDSETIGIKRKSEEGYKRKEER